MTPLPPLDSSSVQRLAGSAATSAGATIETGGFTGTGAGLAATKAIARKGKATKRLFIPKPPTFLAAPTIAGRVPAPELFPLRGYIGRHGRRHELVDRAAIARNFFHQP